MLLVLSESCQQEELEQMGFQIWALRSPLESTGTPVHGEAARLNGREAGLRGCRAIRRWDLQAGLA